LRFLELQLVSDLRQDGIEILVGLPWEGLARLDVRRIPRVVLIVPGDDVQVEVPVGWILLPVVQDPDADPLHPQALLIGDAESLGKGGDAEKEFLWDVEDVLTMAYRDDECVPPSDRIGVEEHDDLPVPEYHP